MPTDSKSTIPTWTEWRRSVRVERKRRGMTLEGLGKAVGFARLTASVMSTIERGVTFATDDEMWALCCFLGLAAPVGAGAVAELRWRAVAGRLRARMPTLFEAMLAIAEAAIADTTAKP